MSREKKQASQENEYTLFCHFLPQLRKKVDSEAAARYHNEERRELLFMIQFCLAVVLFLLALLLFFVWPNTGRRQQMQPFEQVYIAHRGLFDNKSNAPENSLAAFRKAVAAGYGIELDIQLTADHQLVVVHDATLRRMAGADVSIRKSTYAQLQRYTLAQSRERVPLLSEVLKVIGGKVPLIAEIKVERNDYLATTEAAAALLDDYHGVYCVESFHPLVVQWYRKNRPQVIRGQLATDYAGEGQTERGSFMLTHLLSNVVARPDFIAYNVRFAKEPALRLCKLLGAECVAWTVRSQAQLAESKRLFDVVIFDSFCP